MLDLMTLAVSVGLQEEMKEVREETNAAFVEEQTPVEEETPLTQAADTIEQGKCKLIKFK